MMQGSGRRVRLLMRVVAVTALLQAHLGWAQEEAAEAAADEAQSEIARSQWELQTELGAGYDTNANGSTSVQSFLGFPLDPRYVATRSSFAQAGLTAQHTLNLSAASGFITTTQLSHRINPDAAFADQTIAALGTEGILGRGAGRFSFALGAYTSWLHGHGDERGATLDLNAAHAANDLETVFTLRVSRVENEQREFSDLEVDRYLAAFSLSRTNLGAREASVGVALVGGHDSPVHSDSPFGNNRFGAQLSSGWKVHGRARAYLELSILRSAFRDRFFDLERTDDQLSAAAALEVENCPAPGWILAPQVQYLRNESTVPLFEYDRLEAVIYLRRAL